MTDDEFVAYYKLWTKADKWDWLAKNCSAVHIRRTGQGYTINCPEDLDAVVEQELYERMTGRE